jgi:hypothetical protein
MCTISVQAVIGSMLRKRPQSSDLQGCAAWQRELCDLQAFELVGPQEDVSEEDPALQQMVQPAVGD